MEGYEVSERSEWFLMLHKKFRELVDELAEGAIGVFGDNCDEQFKPVVDAAVNFEGLILDLFKESVKSNLIDSPGKRII